MTQREGARLSSSSSSQSERYSLPLTHSVGRRSFGPRSRFDAQQMSVFLRRARLLDNGIKISPKVRFRG